MPRSFAFTASLIVLSVIAGYLSRRLWRDPARTSLAINTGTLIALEPLAIAISFWAINPGGSAAIRLPLFATGFTTICLLGTAMIARRTGKPKGQQGSWALCAAFSNQGATFGTFLLFSAWGERGFVLGTLYAIYFMPMLTTVGFQVARSFGEAEKVRGWGILAQVFRDRRSRNPVLAVLIGAALQIWGPARPELLGKANQFLIPLNTFLYLYAIGLTTRLAAIAHYSRSIATIAAAKFVALPMLAYAVGWALGFAASPNRELLRVVVVQNSTPVAIMAVVTASIFHLDQELANSAWIVTNFGAVALVPWLTFLSLHL